MYREGSVDCVIKVVLLHAIQGPGMLYGKHTTKGPELQRDVLYEPCAKEVMYSLFVCLFICLCVY